MNQVNRRRALAACLLFGLATLCAPLAAQALGAPSAALDNGVFAPVVINELLPHTDPPQVDSVELFNPTDATASIGGWCLSDKDDNLCRYRFPDDATIAPRGFLVVTQVEWNAGDGDNWGLSELGETVYLSQAAPGAAPAGYRHEITFGATANGVAVGRVVTSDGREYFPPLQWVTLGAPNAAPTVGPIVFAEIMYHPPDAQKPEYLELYNTGQQRVRLYDPTRPQNRWRLEGVGPRYYLPPGSELEPGESLYVTNASADDFRAAYGLGPEAKVAGPYFGTLNDDDDALALLRPDVPNLDGEIPYIVVDAVDYRDGPPWPVEADGGGPALQRATLEGFGQEPKHWRASTVGLESGPAIQVLAFEQWPQIGGGRRLLWETAWEWQSVSFRVLRSDTGLLSDAQPVGGVVPAAGSRHQGHAYALVDPTAEADGSYRYWLEWTSVVESKPIEVLTAGPWRSFLLPVTRSN